MNIFLVCNAGMSTSILVKKMQEAAEAGVVAEEIKDEPQQEQSQIAVIAEKQPQEEIVEEVSETDIIVEEE